MTTDEEVWIRAWAAVANANDCKNSDTARTLADKCLAAFRERFPAPASNPKDPTP